MSEPVTIKLDGREFEVKPGELVIKAAEDQGTYIPRFCWHRRMKPVGMCRMCLVEVDTGRGPMLITACTNEVVDGMAVDTQNDTVKKAQEAVLEFLLANHPLDCPVCDKGGECPLQDQAMAYGPGESRFVEIKRTFEKPIPISDLVLLDRERCILCARCTRFSEEISGDPLIEFQHRGNVTEVNTFPDHPFSSYFSGNTVQICPVGALTAKPYRFRARPWDLEMVESSSLYDPAHPRVSIHVSQNEILRLVGVDSEPVNQGWLSDKDRWGYEQVRSPNRLTTPLVRRGGDLKPVSWSEALDMVGNRFDLILEESGGQSIAVLGGANGTNEDAYALSRFARTALETNNVDCRTGDGPASHFVAATADRALISDLDSADTILVWGPDLKETHPTLYLRVRRAAQELAVKLVIIHPRETGLDDRATTVVRYRPGGGHDLLSSIEAGDHADLAEMLTGKVVAIVGQASLADAPELAESVAGFIRDRAATPRIMPLVERANTYGALDMGLSPDLLPGRVAYGAGQIEAWGEIPEDRGRDSASMLAGLQEEELRAVLLVGADPVGNSHDPTGAAEALEMAEYVVSIDTFLNDSNHFADVIFPAAGFSEQEGTVTNLEGRVQKVNEIIPAPGQARPDWAILDDLSSVMGKPMGLSSAALIAKEIAAVAPAYQGVTWDLLEWDARDGAVVPIEGSQPLTHIPVMVDGPKGPSAELLLHQARVMYDDGVRLRNCPSLHPLAPGPVALINPEDAKRLGARHDSPVKVVTSKGEGEFSARIDASTPPGVVFVPLNQPGAARLGSDPVVRVTVVT
ncbi:MAG: NADH-quinone oxidoreductase subunit NuoG [Acidimicrobiia bacterium]